MTIEIARPIRSALLTKICWVVAIGLAALEFAIPMHFFSHVSLTVIALASVPLFGTLMVSRFRRRADDAPEGLRFGPWTFISFAALCIVFVVAEIVKLQLLMQLKHGTPGNELLRGYRNFTSIALAANLLVLFMRPKLVHRLLTAVAEHTARLAAVSFAVVIFIGAFLLMLPVSVRSSSDISGIDALFTSAGAVCVTGLAVNQISSTYTFFGQIVLLVLIQIGGLGIMVLYGAVAAFAGRTMSTKSARMLSEVIDVASLSAVRRMLMGIVVFALVVEAIGAVAFYFTMKPVSDIATGPEAGLPLSGAQSLLWAAIFHSVSAFCNAGYSLFQGGMVPFASDWAVSFILMALVIVGGLGFPVCFELLQNLWSRMRRRRPDRLSLHSRIVLSMSAFLLILGTVAYLLLEWSRSMQGLSIHAKVLTAAFQSTISRTAGFNTLDYSKMAAGTWLFTCVLMFIGASPGSTGGGIKTTTFAVLAAATRSDLMGRRHTELWRRSISAEMVRKAVGVTLISGAVVVFITFLLLLTERFEPLRLGFETVSALATVGLSTGITPELSNAGKLVITVAMYLGRIGPLTLAAALATGRGTRALTLPEERIGIG